MNSYIVVNKTRTRKVTTRKPVHTKPEVEGGGRRADGFAVARKGTYELSSIYMYMWTVASPCVAACVLKTS